MENLFYSKRNEKYIKAAIENLRQQALQKGFFGSFVVDFKIQEGIIQLASYELHSRLGIERVSDQEVSRTPTTAMAEAFKKAKAEE